MPKPVRPYRPHYFPRTHRGNPLPPPLGTVSPSKPLLTDEQLERFEKSGIFLALVVVDLIVNLLFALGTWLIIREFANNNIISGPLPYWDAFWITFLIRFMTTVSRHLGNRQK